MAEGHQGVIKQHSRAYIAHHGANARPILGSITMDLTFAAAALAIPFRALIHPTESIIAQVAATGAEPIAIRAVKTATID